MRRQTSVQPHPEFNRQCMLIWLFLLKQFRNVISQGSLITKILSCEGNHLVLHNDTSREGVWCRAISNWYRKSKQQRRVSSLDITKLQKTKIFSHLPLVVSCQANCYFFSTFFKTSKLRLLLDTNDHKPSQLSLKDKINSWWLKQWEITFDLVSKHNPGENFTVIYLQLLL